LPTGAELAEFVPATVTLFAAFTSEAGSTLTLTPVGLAAVTCPLMATSWPADDVAECVVVVVVAAGLAAVLGAVVDGAAVAGAVVLSAGLPEPDLAEAGVPEAGVPEAGVPEAVGLGAEWPEADVPDVVAVAAGVPAELAPEPLVAPAWPGAGEFLGGGALDPPLPPVVVVLRGTDTVTLGAFGLAGTFRVGTAVGFGA
jgi:hypothetical protein